MGPHCVFDVVIPYQNSSHKESIVGQYCTPEHATGGAAVGDYDGDGMEDIFFTVFHGRSLLYKNNGEFVIKFLSLCIVFFSPFYVCCKQGEVYLKFFYLLSLFSFLTTLSKCFFGLIK